jgi:hypothetical protein
VTVVAIVRAALAALRGANGIIEGKRASGGRGAGAAPAALALLR